MEKKELWLSITEAEMLIKLLEEKINQKLFKSANLAYLDIFNDMSIEEKTKLSEALRNFIENNKKLKDSEITELKKECCMNYDQAERLFLEEKRSLDDYPIILDNLIHTEYQSVWSWSC